MVDNNAPIPPAAGQDSEHDGDAAYRTYLYAGAPPIPPGQIQEFGYIFTYSDCPIDPSSTKFFHSLNQTGFASRAIGWHLCCFHSRIYFSTYVALCLEITVGPDGDSINQFEVETVLL